MKETHAEHLGLRFGPGEDYSGPEHFLGSTHGVFKAAYDFLIFTDSRGMACNSGKIEPWALRIAKYLEQSGYSVLLVCRPKVLTVFVTLINFLRANGVKYTYLVTNLGFVDFTPKKHVYMEDISAQFPEELRRKQLPIVEFPPFVLSSGESENLYAYDFGPASEWVTHSLESFFCSGLLIHAFEASAEEKWPRLRPRGFYEQIVSTNRWLENMSVRAPRFGAVCPLSDLHAGNQTRLTYDAVHLTRMGHECMFAALRDALANKYE